MKYKFLLGALMLGSAFSAFADGGYTDGIDYYNAGQYVNAQTILDRTINDANTDKALAYYYLGQIELLYKKNAEAKAYFEKGLQANPQNPYNYVGMGNYYLQTGNTKEAETNFKEALKLGKKNNEIPVEIARAYYTYAPADAKNMETVRKYIDKARKESKNTEPSIYILEGDMLYDEGIRINEPQRLGDAAAQYEMAITYDNANPEGYVKYARAYMKVNPDFSVAKLEELLSKQPNSALAQRELAERYYDTNQWHKAVKQYGEYINNPNHFPEDKARYSFLLWVYKDYENAIKVADEILAEDPGNLQAQRIKMLAQADLKDWAAAEQTAIKFFNSTGVNFTQTDYNTYANILQNLNRPADALEQYKAAAALNPENPETLTNLAMGYSAADFNQEAAETMQKAIECTENPTLTQYYRASGLWLFAASTAEQDEVKIADANKGIEDIDKVIAGAAEVTPDYLRRRAQLLYTRDLGEVTPEVGQAYEALVIDLDKDPANMDPNNSSNRLKWYEQAYKILNKYYENQGATDKKDAVVEKYVNVETLLGK